MSLMRALSLVEQVIYRETLEHTTSALFQELSASTYWHLIGTLLAPYWHLIGILSSPAAIERIMKHLTYSICLLLAPEA